MTAGRFGALLTDTNIYSNEDWPPEVPLPSDPEWKRNYAASVRRLVRHGVDVQLGNLFLHAARSPECEAREIYRARMENAIPSGVVLTGGTSLLEGVSEVAESVFKLPARIGKPMGIKGLVDVVNNPMYATGVGLVLFGARNKDAKKFRIRDKNIFNRVMARMKRWFNEVV